MVPSDVPRRPIIGGALLSRAVLIFAVVGSAVVFTWLTRLFT